MDSPLRRKPGLRRNNQGLDARRQRRVDNRREQWAVVDRKLVDSARFLGFRVDIGIGAAHKPKYGRNVPFGSERSEVLARRRWAGLPDALGGEVSAKGVDYALARLRIIHVEGIMIQRRDLRRPRCA